MTSNKIISIVLSDSCIDQQEVVSLIRSSDIVVDLARPPYRIVYKFYSQKVREYCRDSEKTLYILPASIVSVFLNISLNVILIPKFGALGAVMALSFTSIFSSMVHLYFGFKLYPIPVKWRELAGMYLFTLIFTIPIYLFMITDIVIYVKIVSKIIIILMFLLAGLKFNYISKENINMLLGKIKLRFTTKLTIQKT